ncbi:MAG: prepilin peptidase [Candidatus Omnitrophica bacterium]|nr:prepilin peptidase [Candidatus Omnitrophota bacterium]
MIIKIFVFTLGSIIGSFLNVCIYRLPVEKSLIKPSSHCPQCEKPILWYDNIPLLSYLMLRGRCRFCKGRIPFQYFLVELITAVMFLSFYTFFIKDIIVAAIYCLLGSGLLAASFIDLKYKIIPDEISVYGLIIGFVLSLLYPPLQSAISGLPPVATVSLGALFRLWPNDFLASPRFYSGVSSLLGILAGGGSIYLIGVLGNIIFRKESMGAGDVKLMAMMGAFLGLIPMIFIFFIAPVFGAIVGIIVKIKTKEDIIPYGPFLSLAAFVVIFWGRHILDWFSL